MGNSQDPQAKQENPNLVPIHEFFKKKGDKVEVKEADVQDFSRVLMKMPNKQDKKQTDQIVEELFKIAATRMKDPHDKQVLEGLAKYVKTTQEDLLAPKPRHLDAFFFPNEKNMDKLVQYLQKAQKSMNVCVFNITNDKLANALNDAHRRGVVVRVISDDECMNNLGSDVKWLAGQGVPVRTDNNAQFHMHNKFVVVDDTFLVTGSFNWTVQAGKSNQENIIVVDHPYYIEKYNTEFETLWKQFSKNIVKGETEQLNDAACKIQGAYRAKKGTQTGDKQRYN